MTKAGWAALALMAVGLTVAAAFAAEPAAPPATPAAAPVADPPPAPDVEAVLDKMEDAGKNLKALSTPFNYELQTLYDKPEETQKRKGNLYFQSPNLLRLEFNDKDKSPETFVFDGRKVFHRMDSVHELHIWELRAPGEKPVESLALGKTPFPVPFGQKKEDVLKAFTVKRDIDEEGRDKENKRSVLQLTPKPGTSLARDYKEIKLWIDPKTGQTTRIQLLDTSENRTTVDFTKIDINQNLKANLFARPVKEGEPGWDVKLHEKEK
jgi:outer membrane lipoprotein-sorting protein